MSNIYIQEPPTKGKVCLKTSVGDIDIELWSKESPKACRNFVQLCMEGYYDGTIFHRLVKEFIVQGGDPTGTGMGGESIYGAPFKDEFHSRLRFMRRGLVAMANAGKNDNGSQFFFTLVATPELTNKHTIFGKVEGNTLFNMLKLGESEVDRQGRPTEPHKIISATIITNPFDDIVPRTLPKKKEKKEKEKPTVKGTKNFNLLSFGEEAEEDEEETEAAVEKLAGKPKSAHDVLEDEKLSKELAVDSNELHQPGVSENEEEVEERNEAMRERIREKLSKKKRKGVEEEDEEERKRVKKNTEEEEDEDLDQLVALDRDEKEQEKVDALKSEALKLAKEVVKSRRKVEPKVEPEKEETEAMKVYKAERDRYMEAKNNLPRPKTGARESQTLEILAKFQEKLKSVATEEVPETVDENGKEDTVSFLDAEDIEGDDWMSKKFVAIDPEVPKRAKEMNIVDEDTYDINDPRHPFNVKRREGEGKKDRSDRPRDDRNRSSNDRNRSTDRNRSSDDRSRSHHHHHSSSSDRRRSDR